MKPFHFPLESLRVLRKQKERAAQQRYARSLGVCDQTALQLQNAATELVTGRNMLGLELNRGIVADRLTNLRTWCQVLEIRRNERQSALAEARRTADLAFQEMIAAARDRETLDRFHDKFRRAHEREVQREEQKTFDELAVQLNSAPGPLQFVGQTN